jgi:dihydroflavonol-4-reductase
MRVLITGATGFIGSHLAESLHAQGYALRCLVRKTSNLLWLRQLPIEYIYGDLFDLSVLRRAVADVDYVYHLAGITKAKTKAEYYLGNHIATKNLLDAVLEVKPGLKRFLHVSTQAAVGPSTNGEITTEATPFHPITTYGISKMKAEMECLDRKDALPITIVRPPVVYGPRDKDVFEFFNTMRRGIQPMVGFAAKRVSMIHVLDLVRGTIMAAEYPRAVGETYFIADRQPYTWKEIGDATCRVMGRKALRVRIPEFGVYAIAACAEFYSLITRRAVLINFEKARDMVQNSWTCDPSKARRELGFTSALTIEQGIAETVEWYIQQGWLSAA